MRHTNASRDLAAGVLLHWTDRAACRTLPDAEIMWPLAGEGSTVEAARVVCRRCPVVLACLREGAQIGEWCSVRGGLTGDERHRHHEAGLAPHQYPPHQPQVKLCCRCGGRFTHDPTHPFTRMCRPCALSHPDKQVREQARNPATFMRRVSTGVCVRCGRDRQLHARRLCYGCYHAVKKARQLDRYPTLAMAGGAR